MKYGSVCSGIEAATVAWHSLGMDAAWYSEIEKFPSRVLEHHYPNVKNLGDMTKIADMVKNNHVEAPEILVGGTPCFTSGHMVLTATGYQPIENISVGDLVVTHEGRLKPVICIGSKIAPVGLLSANGLPSGIKCTAEHPFRSVVWRMQNTKRSGKYCRIEHLGQPKWTPASQMVGKQWCALTQFNLVSPLIQSSKFDNKTAMYITGMYLGDGHIRRWSGRTKKAVILNLNPAKYEKFLLAVGDLTHTVSKERTSVRVHIYDTIFCDWLISHFGEYSHSKILPAWVLGHQYQSELMKGYIDTDGAVAGNCTTINSTSKSLAYGIADLFNANGFAASVAFIKTANMTVIEGRIVNQRDYWQMRAFPQELSRKSRIRHNYLLRSVSSYEDVGNDTVFNIEVADDHSYILNGAIVHNCQAFSVAGLRNSLSDDRGQLTLEFVRLANEIDTARSIRGSKPALIVWENVPGVLSTKDNAFGSFLGALSGSGSELKPSGRKWSNAGCVFGPQRQIYWRVLDAQYFGLPQRRKRVFVVASARTKCIREILFESESLLGDIEEGRSKGESIARSRPNYTGNASTTVSGKTYTPPILASHGQKKWLGNQEAFCGDYYIQHTIGIGAMTANAAMYGAFPTLLANHDRGYLVTYGIQGNIIGRSIHAGGNGLGFKSEQAPTLTGMDRHGVLYCGTKNDYLRDLALNVAPTLRTGGKGGGAINQAIFQYMPSHIFHAARYLTEIECERLQGFPDNYTNIPKAAATHRYKALGNSMAVPVMKWIGERIQKYLESDHE